jgi:hypothetical protein
MIKVSAYHVIHGTIYIFPYSTVLGDAEKPEWSSGMIPALGAGGLRFKPGFGPLRFFFGFGFVASVYLSRISTG